jgi:hexosaminidase
LKLLPYPRSLRRQPGNFILPPRAVLQIDLKLSHEEVTLPVAKRLQSAMLAIGVDLELSTRTVKQIRPTIRVFASATAPAHPASYWLEIEKKGIGLRYRDAEGLRAGVATLRQMLREYGKRLPCVSIRDYPDFAKRGLMLDVSRGRVPKLETLMELASHLADFKINEIQLYTEHTFAYRNYKPVWRDWSPLTVREILAFDAYCRKLGIELVPNQNSFGHLRYWLAYPPLKKLAEISEPWPDQGGAFLRHPATLAPNNPGTLPFLRELYDELLPNFTSQRFNVGCDETWDLGRGQTKKLCDKIGKGRVYVDFLKKIYRETSRRKKQMMFWGDIILHYPELVKELPKDVVALNWGYEATHPFEKETKVFAESKMPFYVCPGTSTWMSLIGRHDIAFANLKLAARAGLRNGAAGYLNSDWGDGGHLQPLAVSYLPYLLGASVSWCAKSHDDKLLLPVLNRDVFEDPTGKMGAGAMALGRAHLKFKYTAPNVTPFGTVIAAPPPELRELFCRDGLKYFARIPEKNVRAALREVKAQRAVLKQARPATKTGKTLRDELALAARMAAQSCEFMLWQQAVAAGRTKIARALATRGIAEMRAISKTFNADWPKRNKGVPQKIWPFARWRIRDYRRGVLPIPREIAAIEKRSTSAD